ncbi:MAG TPA: hypothetical protein VEM40_02550 [Nitrospirota bacterium]|nr:hypothetical protein [Nitrospirota bacterium]
MKICSGDGERIRFLYRDPLFERGLEDLRKKGGEAAGAAKKVDEFVCALTQSEGRNGREKFRFTRNGEYRIRNCRKVDLGSGYRLVCIKKGPHLSLLYVGTHDDCFRWIERNIGLKYEFDAMKTALEVAQEIAPVKDDCPNDALNDQRMFEEYESSIMSRVDDAVLRKVFSGLCQQRPLSKKR